MLKVPTLGIVGLPHLKTGGLALTTLVLTTVGSITPSPFVLPSLMSPPPFLLNLVSQQVILLAQVPPSWRSHFLMRSQGKTCVPVTIARPLTRLSWLEWSIGIYVKTSIEGSPGSSPSFDFVGYNGVFDAVCTTPLRLWHLPPLSFLSHSQFRPPTWRELL